jgi:CubicO group peptidase (beta-lactamase class C family)
MTVEDSRRTDPILTARPCRARSPLTAVCADSSPASAASAGSCGKVPPVDPGELAGLIAPYVTGGGPGHAAGVYRGGTLVAHAAAGCAVIEHDVPIDAGTIFDIASASKQFTAACLLLLQRDGVLSLDDDVRRHLPELLLPVPVTLRQCLSHTGGLREYYSLCELAGVPVAGMDEARLMRLLAGQTGLNFPPGTGWSYSNSGFVLAAAALRRVSGRSLAEFAAERLFGPLGMRVTRFRDDLTMPVPALATGYAPGPDGSWRRADITEEVVGDGGVVTSVHDLAGWQRFMLTGAVLGADIRDGLLEPAVLADGRGLPYALGLEITNVGGRRVYLHSGHIDGFRSALAYLIDSGMGVAVLANRDDTFPAEIAVRIAERLAGVAAPVPPARLGERAALAAQPAVTGLWYSPELDTHLAIGADGDGTVTHVEGGATYRYAAMSDGSWRGLGGVSSIRLRLADGELRLEEIVGDEPPEVYARAGEPPTAAPPAGTYYSEELHAHATLAAADGGARGTATLAAGLAPPRTVSPASGGAWAGDGLTVRPLAGGAELEISLYGARRCRFARIDGTPPPRQRGL